MVIPGNVTGYRYLKILVQGTLMSHAGAWYSTVQYCSCMLYIPRQFLWRKLAVLILKPRAILGCKIARIIF